VTKIPTLFHGIRDYTVGGGLLAMPQIFRFGKKRGLPARLPQAIGAGIIGMSLLTRYECGAKKWIPMKRHLGIHFGAGALMTAAPWLFRLTRRPKRYWVPLMVTGIAEMVNVVLTETKQRKKPMRWLRNIAA
jgi:hypothetical protein